MAINLESNSRNFGVDLARTLAISMVIMVHITGIGFGRFGVQLFFVISGYLLGNYWQTQSKVEFLIHRAFRLFPLSITFILLFYLNKLSNPIELILNLALLQNIFWASYSFPGGWSISTEWIFSIFLIIVLPKYTNKLIYMFSIICLLQILTGAFIFLIGGVNSQDSTKEALIKTWINTTNPIINLGFFISGILILRYRDKIWKIHKCILLTCLFLMILEDKFIGHLMIGWQLAIPSIFILCLKTNTENRIVRKTIIFIGKRTYGAFFVHFLIYNNLQLVFSESQRLFLTQERSGRLLQFIFVYFASLIGGALTYKFIEKPFLNLSKKIRIS